MKNTVVGEITWLIGRESYAVWIILFCPLMLLQELVNLLAFWDNVRWELIYHPALWKESLWLIL